jgi:hypothetical protein
VIAEVSDRKGDELAISSALSLGAAPEVLARYCRSETCCGRNMFLPRNAARCRCVGVTHLAGVPGSATLSDAGWQFLV